ncbi:sugar phosphate isomerase/epimerase family protein [Cupriavidus sp. a3]|uniref:sugar phosphate isomerase/epimerase family protein n=1 Tax=Cupriavidus sp. a3 TaxID=3242158 RepID=UPI003D9C544F
MSNSPSPDPTRLSINTATLWESCNLVEAAEALQRHGIRGIAPWRNRVAEIGVAEARRVLDDCGLTVSGLCRGGMFTAGDDAGRQAAIDDNLRAIDEAAALGARCLVMVCGGLPPGSKDLDGARKMVRDGLGAILGHARASGIPIAIEPLHPMTAADRSVINTLGQALDLCDELDPQGAAALGVAVDAYHVWWDPELRGQLSRAGKGRIHAFHICDWLVQTTDLVLDRGMMGDGVIDLRQLRNWVEENGYDGMHEVEIFSMNDWWKRPVDEVLQICKARHAEVC